MMTICDASHRSRCGDWRYVHDGASRPENVFGPLACALGARTVLPLQVRLPSGFARSAEKFGRLGPCAPSWPSILIQPQSCCVSASCSEKRPLSSVPVSAPPPKPLGAQLRPGTRQSLPLLRAKWACVCRCSCLNEDRNVGLSTHSLLLPLHHLRSSRVGNATCP